MADPTHNWLDEVPQVAARVIDLGPCAGQLPRELPPPNLSALKPDETESDRDESGVSGRRRDVGNFHVLCSSEVEQRG